MTLPWSLGAFSPVQNGTIAATTSSQAIALGGSTDASAYQTGPNCAVVSNIGTVEAFVLFGDSTVTAIAGGAITAANDGSASVPAGAIVSFQANIPGITHMAAITASGTTTIRVSRGYGS